MADSYVLMNFECNSILGVFTSGKKLTNAVKNMTKSQKSECVVHFVPQNEMYYGEHEAGYDHQGTMLDEFLHTPAASMN